MYRIDREKNRIERLESKKFSDLGFQERKHLQEWLANEPMALGEELLIIQKEFDGFADTRERLDLLAIDKLGNLVIIENKLDDSGRDVIWQAIKYASYCSSLSKAQIVEIYQDYLNVYDLGESAQEKISDFLDEPDFGEVVLNAGTNQRIMFVAANFRKEVTSTAMWLLSHNIQINCFKVTPFCMGENLLLNVEQIIPTPEAEEYMIGMSAKEAEQKSNETTKRNRQNFRLEFWEQALEQLRKSSIDLYDNISPSKDHWISAGSGLSGAMYNLIFGSKLMRVEFCFARVNKEDNKFLFDQLFSKKDKIEHVFGAELSWERNDDKKGSYIRLENPADGDNRDSWPQITSWMIEHLGRFEKAIKQPLMEAGRALKKRSELSSDQSVP